MKVIPTFTITEFAKFKGTTRTTVYANLDKLNLNERGKIVWDKKAEKWEPENKKINKRYKKGKQ